MSSNLTSQFCYRTCLKSTKHYSPTQAASSFLIQPSLQSWQSLLLEPVQVLQAAWQAEIRENYNLSFVGRLQDKFGHTNSQRKILFRIHWKLLYFSSLSLPFTRLDLDFMEVSFTKMQLYPTKPKLLQNPGSQTWQLQSSAPLKQCHEILVTRSGGSNFQNIWEEEIKKVNFAQPLRVGTTV